MAMTHANHQNGRSSPLLADDLAIDTLGRCLLHALSWAKGSMQGDAFAQEQLFLAAQVQQRMNNLMDRYDQHPDLNTYAEVHQRLLGEERLGLFGEPWLSPFDEPKLRGLLKEFGMRLQGSDGDGGGGDEDRLHLEIAASKASRSSDAIYQQRMRIPSHDFAQTPLLLACGVVEMSMPMQLGDRMAEEKE
jgi:hypothetical protein